MCTEPTFDYLLSVLTRTASALPDHRTGRNVTYEIADAVLGAFAVFFTQSPSFLAHQRDMQRMKGQNNASSLFGVHEVPTDPQIRNLLDPLSPALFGEAFWEILDTLHQNGYLDAYQPLEGHWLCCLDGTQYFSSTKIHCPECTVRMVNGVAHYSHSMLTPVLVAPGERRVIALMPEFITPQDGVEKQDCEIRAAERWVRSNVSRFAPHTLTFLGDDLYCHQPFCELLDAQQCGFIFTCKPESHLALYDEIALLRQAGAISHICDRRWNGKEYERWEYAYVNHVPLTADPHALEVNWCELRITIESTGEVQYYNAWATSHTLSDTTVRGVAEAGRSRWKVENENNNVLKRYGYHLEHSFGHGHQHLATILVLLNVLAFLFHTVIDLCDDEYRRVRAELGTRQTFFNDISTLTRYLYFQSWKHLLHFMFVQLELDKSS